MPVPEALPHVALQVYERAITQAENAGEDHPATFRDPRTHTMISKRLLLHKAKLWESFNHGESTFAFDLEEDRLVFNAGCAQCTFRFGASFIDRSVSVVRFGLFS